MKKLLWAAAFAVCLCLCFSLSGKAYAAETVDSGTCGDEGDGSNLTWTLDSEGTLTISGSGKMKDYTYILGAPWFGRKDTIQKAVLEEGVTSIGSFAFYECSGLTSVTIPRIRSNTVSSSWKSKNPAGEKPAVTSLFP